MTRSPSTRQDVIERLRRQTRGPLWPRGRRTALGIGYLAAVGVTALGGLVPGGAGTAVTAAGLLAVVVLLMLLRKATRLVADAPDAALDEMLVRLRGECFVVAYQFLGATCVLIGAVLLVVGGAYGLSAAGAEVCGLLLVGLALGLPVVIVALTLPDVDPHD
ncbi:MAG: hypothetical protein WAL50_13010 [Kineosporiaceae bacterium]|jgi:hypothetical protein